MTGMATFNGFGDDAFEFYEGLRADNSKTYWTAHRHVYDAAVRAPMQALLDSLAAKFDGTPVLFRPYRDVRFSADKSPYKTNQGGFLEVAGGLGYWLSLDADGIAVGGGFHAHDKAQTARFRAAIDDETIGGQLVRIVEKLVKAGFQVGGDAVRTRPRGVAVDHPRLDLMRHESLTVSRRIDPVASATATFATALATDWKRVATLVDWCRTNAAPS
jgi:uncharacterized protein (TIGR02453 family)